MSAEAKATETVAPVHLAAAAVLRAAEHWERVTASWVTPPITTVDKAAHATRGDVQEAERRLRAAVHELRRCQGRQR